MINGALIAALTLLGILASFRILLIIWILACCIRRTRQTKRRSKSLSFDYVTEPFFLSASVVLSSLSSGSAWYNHPLTVALVGTAIIIGTYILLFGLLYLVRLIYRPENQNSE